MWHRWPTLLGNLILVALGSIVLGIGWSPTGTPLSKSSSFSDSSAWPENPPGIIYELRTSNALRRFHVGEPIPISMCFSATIPDRFRLSAATYDRSGRMNQDRFLVAPSVGHRDPMEEYFRTGVLLGLAGGIRSSPILTKKPICIEGFLNEWVRFERPGTYEVVAGSYRIEKEVEGADEPRTEWVEVRSSPMRIEIAKSDSQWEEEELARITSGSSGAGETNQPNDTQRLRFLGTVGTLDPLTKRLGDGGNGTMEAMFGLIESVHRSEALAAMTRYFESPESAVSVSFVSILAFLRVRDRYTEWLPDLRVGRRPSKTEISYYEHLFQRYQRIHDDETASVASELAGILPSKLTDVRPQCLRTLAKLNPELARRANGGRPVIVPEFPLSFPFQPREATPKPPSPNDTNFRELVLKDLAKAEPIYPLETLTSLQDQHLPGYEVHFAERTKDNPALFGRLLVRYGSRTAFPTVRNMWQRESHYWACDSRVPFLAFFFKAAPDEGMQILREAMADRKDNGCFLWYPDRLAESVPATLLEPLVIDLLDDPDGELVSTAAQWLSRHGSPASQYHLWRRLRVWHDKWHGRLRELVGNPITRPAHSNPERRIGPALVSAIYKAQGWYLDNRKVEELARMCIESHCREQLRIIGTNSLPVKISIGSAGYRPRWVVGQYEPGTTEYLAAKLSQYPAGTEFGWCGDREHVKYEPESDSAERAQWFAKATQLVERYGHRLDRTPPFGTCRLEEK